MAKSSISQLPRALALPDGKPALSRVKIYDLVVTGVIPATFENGRWYFDPDRIDEIRQALGLTAPTDRVAA